MKKKIIILGSTGSIGKNTIDVIRRNKTDFKIELLSTNKDISQILKQAKEFKVKNIIINNKKISYNLINNINFPSIRKKINWYKYFFWVIKIIVFKDKIIKIVQWQILNLL